MYTDSSDHYNNITTDDDIWGDNNHVKPNILPNNTSLNWQILSLGRPLGLWPGLAAITTVR